MRTVMANGCLQLHRTAPCDAVSTRSRPSESLIGTIRGFFNYIWADNKDPGQINERKAAGCHRRLVTPMDTSPMLPPAPWLPRNSLWWEQVLKNVCVGSLPTDQPPSSPPELIRQRWRSLSCQGSPVHKVWPLQVLENSTSLGLAFLFIKDISSYMLHPKSSPGQGNINQIISALAMENWLIINFWRKTWYLQYLFTHSCIYPFIQHLSSTYWR